MQVQFYNEGYFVCSFSIQWNGGQSERTNEVEQGDNATIDTTNLGIPDGTSCWARAYIVDGSNHDSSENFTFHADAPEVQYTITGTTSDPSFSCSGCS